MDDVCHLAQVLAGMAPDPQLKASVDDPDYPEITYRRGVSGVPTPVIRGTGIRVETLVIAFT